MAVSLTKKLTSEFLFNTINAYKIGRITETELVQMLQVSPVLYAQLSRYNTEELGKQSPIIGLMDDFNSWNAPIQSAERAFKVASNPVSNEWQEATETFSDVPYSNPVLTAIMLRLKEVFRASSFNTYVTVQEDTPTKWAIHTNEAYYYTVHGIITAVCQEQGTEFKSADTGNPDWDLFCSAT